MRLLRNCVLQLRKIVRGKAVVQSRSMCWLDTKTLPIGPLARTMSLELGLEGFDRPPSRSTPKDRRSAAEVVSSPYARQGAGTC